MRRYYDELWNAWTLDVADELLAPDIRFRGSLGVDVVGVAAFREYVRRVQRAFPDFHNAVLELVAEPERVAARLAYTGTHRGELFGIAPTGRRIRYAGAAFFRLAGGRIGEGWVLGDLDGLRRQLTEG